MAAKKLVDEAVEARKSSGIETTWLECEEAYLGIDDENRAEFAGAKWAKPTTMEGSITRNANSSDAARASAYPRLTARYVDAGAAKLGEIALPVDGQAAALRATPVPEMGVALKDESPILVGGAPVQAIQPAQPGAAPGGQPQQAQPKPLTVADLAKNEVKAAEAKAKKASNRIYDWMIEYNHAAEARKVIFDGARLGAGVLKGPIPEARRASKFEVDKSSGRTKLTVLNEVKPAARWVDIWDFFPDPRCGEDIHQGEYTVERDTALPSALLKLADDPNYVRESILEAIKLGPDKQVAEDTGVRSQSQKTKNRNFTLWHIYAQIKRSDLGLANPDQAKGVPNDVDMVFAIVTLCNYLVIRAVINPMESGHFPYRVFKWRRRVGFWAGVGIAEQVRTPQRIVTATTRRLLDNGGKSSGSIIAIDPTGLESANGGVLTIGGGDTIAWKRADATSDDLRKLIATFQIPNMTPQLMAIIEYGFKLAEEQSSIPLISQGQSGDTTPDTFGGQQLQDNNANQMLRDIGFGYHDAITDPLMRDMYELLMLDPDVPADEKGDMQVDISGACALIEKAMQRQIVMQMGAMIGRPGSRIDPAKWEESFLRMNRLVPADFQYSDEDWDRMRANPPAPPPQVQAAQIRADAQVKTAESRDQLSARKIEVDTDRDLAYTGSLAKNNEATQAARMRELEIIERTANLNYQAKLLDFASKERLSVDAAKVKLAQTTMELNTQVALAESAKGENQTKTPQVAKPATEPPGRAPDGQAFQL